MSSRNTYTISMPSNLPPPHDLTTYSRSMHLHTKRQMEAANMYSSRRSRSGQSPVSSMPNGTSSNTSVSSRGSNGSHEYHT
ncbi:hypothetical protein F5Y19DRAFT_416982 [Xylariaceae sp. FL1651]|nr:hypothetical protein F5Y19DRAFT_416982 [Xylariaceae sp. FL1651]